MPLASRGEGRTRPPPFNRSRTLGGGEFMRGAASGATKTVATNDYGANVCDECVNVARNALLYNAAYRHGD
jgi:hypothetical protein